MVSKCGKTEFTTILKTNLKQDLFVFVDYIILHQNPFAVIPILLYKSKTTHFAQVHIGVEINKKIADRAQHYFKKHPDITILNGDILEVFPEEGSVFFLFNPFDENYLSSFLERAESSVDHKIKLIYLYPTCREVLDKRNRWKIVKEIQLKPRHMGALDLCIYEFDV